MKPFGEESVRKIERHKKMRKGKGFETFEIYEDIKNIRIERNYDGIILECISNVLANEMFGGKSSSPCEDIFAAVEYICRKSCYTVVITNEISSDGVVYEAETETYKKNMSIINRKLAEAADCVIEIVYSIPVVLKIQDYCYSERT